jgi:protein phosphatase
MLVCPQCQFENPTTNRFCQRCGSPLKPLQAILVKGPLAGNQAPTAPDTQATAAALQDWLVADRYLDTAQRYQLRSATDASQPLTAVTQVAVIDCQPGMSAPLLVDAEAAADEVAKTEGLSDLTAPYLELQSQLFPAIPELHAAWERDGYGVLVLEDRTGWRSLRNTWQEEDPDPLEVLHWFYEMTELWQALMPWAGQASLLNPENLRIDDDQILCLQRIDQDRDAAKVDLDALGQCWQGLLADHASDADSALLTLADGMAAGKVLHMDQVQEKLAAIAESLQSPPQAEVLCEEGEDAGSAATPTFGEDDTQPMEAEMALGFPTAVVDTLPPPTQADIDDPDWDTEPEPSLGSEADEPLPIPDSGDFAAIISDEDLMAHLAESDDDPDDEITAGDDGSLGDLPTMALPMQLFRLDEVGRTHVGRQRDHNEDSFFSRTQFEKVDSPSGPRLQARGLYILCDGMGGHAGGEVASALAVSTLESYFAEHWQETLPTTDTIREAITQANQVIFEKNDAEGRSGSGRMGTTLVLVLLQDTEAVVAHVGDSRLYGFTRRQGLQQLTVDHEVGQREIQRGVEPAIAYARPDAYQLTQALGPRGSKDVVPSITSLPVMEDMLLLLCSDGLSDNDVLEHHVTTHVEPLLRSRHDLEEGVSQLIDLANEQNGHDNITALVVRLKLRPNLEALRG